jgi:hypothetical protein
MFFQRIIELVDGKQDKVKITKSLEIELNSDLKIPLTPPISELNNVPSLDESNMTAVSGGSTEKLEEERKQMEGLGYKRQN